MFGLVAGQFFRPARCVAGVKFTGKKILQYSIVLLGFEMQIMNVLAVGSRSLLIMFFTLSAAFTAAAFMYRLIRAPGKQAILIGVGTCICGGSAIAATAPVINADDQDIAQSISTIFLFNIIAVFIFPPLGHLLGLSDPGFGLWAGTAVNDTSSVVATASAWSQMAGNDSALSLATIVKLTRTLLIIPVTLVLAIYTARAANKKTETGAEDGEVGAIEGAGPVAGVAAGTFNLVKIFPWFVIGFVIAALMNSFLPLPTGLPHLLSQSGKFMIVMAMAAIGFSTNLKSLISGGWKPILLGSVCWVAVAVVSLLVQHFSGLM
ncbi:YeiH family protein [Treponema sp.]